MRLYFYILLFGLASSLKAQGNLVKDSSFELYSHLPETIYINRINEMLPYWYQPTNGTPDYYHINSIHQDFDVPINSYPGFAGLSSHYNFQQPKTGNGYVGIVMGNRFDTISRKIVNEYIQTKLSVPLSKNHTYNVGFYINREHNSSMAVSNIGAYISRDSIRQYYVGVNGYFPNYTNFEQKYIPQIANKTYQLITDTVNWVPIKGLYKAKGDEKWITIGRFNDLPENHIIYDTIKQSGGIYSYSQVYYFIDDVFVYEIPSVIFPDTVCKGEEAAFTSTFKGPFKWFKNNVLVSTDSIYTFIAQQSGQYVLQSSYRKDTFNLTVLQNASFDLGNDTFLCLGNNIKLPIPISNAIIQWQTGEKDSVLTISKGGQYIAQVQKNGCSYSDTINVESRLKPGLEYSSSEICTLDSAYVELKLLDNTLKYYWHESKNNELTKKIFNKGCLSLTVMGYNQCNLDTSICITGFCLPVLWIPNAFVPAGVNRIFQCRGINIKDFSMTIYNRWGEKIFISNSIDQGWNGDFKNQVCPAGIYVYIISYSGMGSDKETKVEKGVFELIW